MEVTTFGALAGLTISIILIIKKVSPFFSLVLGAVIGGLLGGVGLATTVQFMIGGSKSITPAVLRILTAGVLAGVLIESGAASKIAQTIVDRGGERFSILALAFSALILTSVGVFVDVTVITVAPIALAIGQKTGLSRMSVLLAMIGGGKAGNVISPNPNTIALASSFKVSLSSLMAANIVPAIVGLLFTWYLANYIKDKGDKISKEEIPVLSESLPSFVAALVGPLVTIFLLALRPLADIGIDPLIALPCGGIAGCIAMGKVRKLNDYITFGLSKMIPVAVLLIGTGTLAGIIQNSGLKNSLIALLKTSGLPPFFLAPVSGTLMSAATASTTAGVTVAAATFSVAITAIGIKALYGAAMMHCGATVLDHLPHGSFFHATAGAAGMGIQARLKLLPYETATGFVLALTSTIIYGWLG